MKKNILIVCSLLCLVSVLVFTAAAVQEVNKPNITISQPTTVMLYDANETATVVLNLPKCYGIEGQWDLTAYSVNDKSQSEKIQLYSVDSPFVQVQTYGILDEDTGLVSWTDVNGDDMGLWLKNPIEGEAISATYSISKDTPEGIYSVTFICSMFTGADFEPNEQVYRYMTYITVEHHQCEDLNTDNDHLCDDENCRKACGDHSYDGVVTVPTCEAGGYTTYTCNCGDSYDSDRVDPLAHKNKEYHERINATCATTGKIEYWSCPDCGKNFSDEACTTETVELTIAIDPNNHDWQFKDYTVNCETHIANYICKNDENHTKSDAAVPHTYDQVGEKCICGAEKPVMNVSVTTSGNIVFSVEGQTVIVTHDFACKVGYWDASANAYKAIRAEANGDGSYSFIVPAEVTDVILVVKGDISGDGRFLANDKAAINSALSGKITLSAEKLFAADITGDGKFLANDKAAINAILAGKITLSW